MRRIILAVGVLAACTMGGWFAARATLSPPAAPTSGSSDLTYEVRTGRVERMLQFTATTSYRRRLLAYGAGSGVVTAVYTTPGQSIDAGDRLYAIDEQPVFAARGAVPAFRDMSFGVRGRDVAQLQGLLRSLGYLHEAADGDFDYATSAAVRQWQAARGRSQTGIVTHGELVFVPRLPARVQLSDSIVVGRQVSPGVDAVYGLSAAPRFEIVLSEEQTDLVPLEAPVAVRAGKETWRGQILQAANRGAGNLVLTLGRANGAALCGVGCDTVPVGKQASYPVDVTAVPSTEGPIVPAAALRSDTSGNAFVTSKQGTPIPVTIIASDGGWSVVEGVNDGEVLNLFAANAEGTAQGNPDGDRG